MEKEEIIARLKEAREKDEDVTIVVRTGVNETQEVPLEKSDIRRDDTVEKYDTWEVLKDKDKDKEAVMKLFRVEDPKGNETVIMERYWMENIEGIIEKKVRG